MPLDPGRIPEYAGNPLIEACGAIANAEEIARLLTYHPAIPASVSRLSVEERVHCLQRVRQLHICTPVELRLATTIDLLLRQGYVHRDPHLPSSRNLMYITKSGPILPPSTSSAATVVGISGTGKTTATEKLLAQYRQAAVHESYPGFVGPYKQLLYLKIDAPTTGRASDLARDLMEATNKALQEQIFGDELSGNSGRRGSASAMLDRWHQIVAAHSLGCLVIDEIQNLFKIPTLSERRRRGRARGELRIVDDETLKFILKLTNVWRIPVLILGTPDGISALFKRFSTAQRTTNGGHHEFVLPASADGQFFSKYLLPQLMRYQWIDKPLVLDDANRELIYRLTGGVNRICVSLWIEAQRQAFDTNRGKVLEPAHLQKAAHGPLRPLAPAIQALLSDDPDRLQLYEDLLPLDAASI